MARRRMTVDDDVEILVRWRAGRGISTSRRPSSRRPSAPAAAIVSPGTSP